MVTDRLRNAEARRQAPGLNPGRSVSLTLGFGPITLNRCEGHFSAISRPRVHFAQLSAALTSNLPPCLIS
jgi:hypothetical protein